MKKSRFFLAVISLFVAITSSAQNISVTGVVTDASTGEPIPFAFCQVKGTTKGSSSDADGRYSIPVVMVLSSSHPWDMSRKRWPSKVKPQSMWH